MRLTELQPEFLKKVEADTWLRLEGSALGDADGIRFLCPACFIKNGGHIGTHSHICWRPHVSKADGFFSESGRWNMTGTGFEDLSFEGAPEVNGNANKSVLLKGGCNAHFVISGGEVSLC